MLKLSKIILLAFCLLASITLINSLAGILIKGQSNIVSLINEPVRADQSATAPADLKPLPEVMSPSDSISTHSYDAKDGKKENKDTDSDKRANSNGNDNKDNHQADNKSPRLISPDQSTAPASPETIPGPELKDSPPSSLTGPSSPNAELAAVTGPPQNLKPLSAPISVTELILVSTLSPPVQPQTPPVDLQIPEPQVETPVDITPLAPDLSEPPADSALPESQEQTIPIIPLNPDVPLVAGSSQALNSSILQETQEPAPTIIGGSPTIPAPLDAVSPLASPVPEKESLLAKIGIIIGFFFLIIIAAVIVTFFQSDSQQ